jgi:hypothetical protein
MYNPQSNKSSRFAGYETLNFPRIHIFSEEKLENLRDQLLQAH